MHNKVLIIGTTALVLAGCTAVSKTAEKATQAVEEKSAQQEVLKNCRFDADVCKYLANTMTTFSKSVTMHSESQIKGYGLQVSETRMDGSGNMQVISYKDKKETNNMIILGKTTYIKDYTDNVWWEQSGSEDDATNPVSSIKEAVNEVKNTFSEEEKDDTVFNKVGQEACSAPASGLTCLQYEMYQQTSPTEKTVVWFDTKEYLARKMETNYRGNTDTTTFDYATVSITKPSPIQAMPTFSSGAAGSTLPSQLDDTLKNLPNDFPTVPGQESSE